MSRLDVWYAKIEADDIVNRWARTADPARLKGLQRTLDKGRRKTSAGAVSRYTTTGPDGLQIISNPPFVEPISQLVGVDRKELRAHVEQIMSEYAQTLPDDLRALIDGYHVVDAGLKVVGVGSVGTRCWIALLVGNDDSSDDLVLQFKEASASVLESVAPASRYPHHGQRVVEGQRLMQSASDMLLGWVRITGFDGVDRDYYVRQMWDWKTAPDLETMDPPDDGGVRPGVRVDAGPCARPQRQPLRAGRVPRVRAYLHPCHAGLRRLVRRPEPA